MSLPGQQMMQIVVSTHLQRSSALGHAAAACWLTLLLLRPLVLVCPVRLDLRDIRVVCKAGGTIDDSELVEGCVFDQKVRGSSPAMTPTLPCLP